MTVKFVNIIEVNSKLKVALSLVDGTLSLLDKNILNEKAYSLSSHSETEFYIVTCSCTDEINSDDFSWYELTEINELIKGHGAILCEALGRLWSFMPNSIESSVRLPSYIYKLQNNSDVTFFGGSFNPWHVGHSECVDQCPNKNLVVVPDANPWKGIEEGGCRFKSYMSIVMTLKETNHSIYSGFWGMQTVNPTVDWIGDVAANKKSLLIGDDNFISFLKWKDVEELIKRVDAIYVVPRNHQIDELSDIKSHILKIKPDLNVIFLNEHAYQDVSSTEIRSLKDSFDI